MADMPEQLPISALRSRFIASLARGPVVVSSPTGSGKSTEVPRWCPGRVLVVEPRRIACRSLATRVAELEQTRVGDGVGYVVRDEHVASPATRIVYVTPGMVLRSRALLASADTVILDEFHERSLDTDLLLALLLRDRKIALVVMSATLDGERVASHVGGEHLLAEGRAFPVDVRYLPGRTSLPDGDDLPRRVGQALTACANDPGDVLVFLPGKAEIEACAQAFSGAYSVIPLHGGLGLDEQRRAFERTPRRKLILATNVAETSLTLPGIGVVIDSGLVRQTRYQAGRGFLALTPIARDSAAQRTGRAGRTENGVCYRLWSPGAQLAESTLPEMYRESLVPLVLTAAAWGERVESLALLDPPKPYALEAAREDLAAWGALQGEAALSASGKSLFELPIEPAHARLLIAARADGCLDDMIDLVSVLAVGRPLFVPGEQLGLDEDLRLAGCDATAAVSALRSSRPGDHGVVEFVLREARSVRARLRRAEGLPDLPVSPGPFDRDAVVRAALAADPRLAHVARTRGRNTYFSNGGTELELARESALMNLRKVEAIVVLDSRALGAGRDAHVLVTCGMPVPLSVLARAGLGQDRLAAVKLQRHRVIAQIERVFANRVLGEREETPQGELARAALVELLVRGSLFRDAVATTREQLTRDALATWLAARGHPAGVVRGESASVTLEQWLRAKVDSLGVTSGDDLALLSASDFVAPPLPYETTRAIDSDYPLRVSVGDASYRADYDLAKNQVTLLLVKGTRSEPPPLSYLPQFPGLRVSAESRRGIITLRAR
jgi:ATP-dependent helicase HrpB